MTDYKHHKLSLTEGQANALAKAVLMREPHSVKLSNEQLVSEGQVDVMLTPTQVSRMCKAIHARKGIVLNLSKAQITKMAQMVKGGFLPFLAGLLPAITAALPTIGTTLGLGALSGAAGFGAQKLLEKATGSGLLDGAIKGAIRGNGMCGDGLYTIGNTGRGYDYSQMGNLGHQTGPETGEYNLLPSHQQHTSPLYLPPEVYPSEIGSTDTATPVGAILRKTKKSKK